MAGHRAGYRHRAWVKTPELQVAARLVFVALASRADHLGAIRTVARAPRIAFETFGRAPTDGQRSCCGAWLSNTALHQTIRAFEASGHDRSASRFHQPLAAFLWQNLARTPVGAARW